MSVIKLLCLLFTAHDYGVLVCVFVSLCQLVHVQMRVMYGMLTNHELCENVGMYSACVYACTCGILHLACWLFLTIDHYYNFSLLLE